jgi:hypothetical protein
MLRRLREYDQTEWEQVSTQPPYLRPQEENPTALVLQIGASSAVNWVGFIAFVVAHPLQTPR